MFNICPQARCSPIGAEPVEAVGSSALAPVLLCYVVLIDIFAHLLKTKAFHRICAKAARHWMRRSNYSRCDWTLSAHWSAPTAFLETPSRIFNHEVLKYIRLFSLNHTYVFAMKSCHYSFLLDSIQQLSLPEVQWSAPGQRNKTWSRQLFASR